jgi:hypothetical protein
MAPLVGEARQMSTEYKLPGTLKKNATYLALTIRHTEATPIDGVKALYRLRKFG